MYARDSSTPDTSMITCNLFIGITITRRTIIRDACMHPQFVWRATKSCIMSFSWKDLSSIQKKIAFVVEHDWIIATYLDDRVIVFEGTPSFESTASAPQSLFTGMNLFLFVSYGINKLESTKDKEQNLARTFY
ncbi:hypothetical protein MKX03_008846 [Papaver bracteatum]|nr:hypothetical protein MKX03_008846 [Papaver bracteatum]